MMYFHFVELTKKKQSSFPIFELHSTSRSFTENFHFPAYLTTIDSKQWAKKEVIPAIDPLEVFSNDWAPKNVIAFFEIYVNNVISSLTLLTIRSMPMAIPYTLESRDIKNNFYPFLNPFQLPNSKKLPRMQRALR